MQFIYVMQVDGNVSPVTPLERDAEIAYVRNLYASGVVRQIWSRPDVIGACLLLECATEEDARHAIDELPLMKAGKLLIQSYLPLQPYKGFAAGAS